MLMSSFGLIISQRERSCVTYTLYSIKCMSVRWLNLETIVECLLKQYEALKSYFESKEEGYDDRLAR